MGVDPYSERVVAGYRIANLGGLLTQIRAADRYVAADGVRALTTGTLGAYDSLEAQAQVRAAANAGRSGKADFQPEFTRPGGGLSHGLNPYTDWTMSVLAKRPTHTNLFLGLDFFDVAALDAVGDWDRYLQNPFKDNDPFWQNVWAWIMNRTRIGSSGKKTWDRPIDAAEAAWFIEQDGGAFVFHNLLPYLRPAGTGSSDKGWPTREWNKPSVRQSVIEDLRFIREQSPGRTIAYCTSKQTVGALHAAGFSDENIVCWGAHPSRYFHPSILEKRAIYFIRQGSA